MGKRIVTACIFVPILFFLVYKGGWWVFGMCMFLSVVGISEYVDAVNHKLEHKLNKTFMMILSAIIVIIMHFDSKATLMCLLICLMLIFCYEIMSGKHDPIRGMVAVFGLLYVPVILSSFQCFDMIPHGDHYIWMVFVIAFCSDTFAYFIGKFFGKRKPFPEISPNKTVAGCVGGIVFGIVGMICYGIFLQQYFGINLPWSVYIISGLIGSIAGQCGDLTASMIKRYTGIKDFGKILPGHGGILDRFDSILFVLPIVYITAVYTFAFIG